uniref:Putative salivary kunitz domain protein n=1 Tax=Ixodes ricinus TaxID=34613 RepID=A0A6B0U150_IXORI
MRFSCILGLLAMCLVAQATGQNCTREWFFGHLAFSFANMEVGGTILGRHLPSSISRTERVAGDIWA